MKRWKTFVLLVVLALLLVGAQAGIANLLAAIDDGKCKSTARGAIELAEAIEAHRREAGEYPVAFDWTTLNLALGRRALRISNSSGGPSLMYWTDGTSYRFAYFPWGDSHLSYVCSCFVISNGRLLGYPRELSRSSVEQIQQRMIDRVSKH